MRQNQLFTLIPDIDLFHYYNFVGNRVVTKSRKNIPFVTWPDGQPCLIVNLFLLTSLNKKKLSTNHRGGTLRAYAKDLTHLIRYCFDNNTDFYEMNNSNFIMFMNGIQSERKRNKPDVKKRESNTSLQIGRLTLNFLDFVGHFYNDDNFVTKVIKATKKTLRKESKKNKSQYFEVVYWHHECFETESSFKTRSPVRKVVIDSLYEAVSEIRSDRHTPTEQKFLDLRNTCLIRCLEMTGARIEEISEIRVSDIVKAISQKDPKLRLVTVKQGEDQLSVRYIPVLHQDLVILKKYYRIYRSKIIKKIIGKKNDHDYFFVSFTTGNKMSSQSLGNLIGGLRRAAGIEEQACAHMFRHRFITKLFVRLLQQFDFENKDDFRRYLLDTNDLKTEIQQYSGHKRLDSLDVYIDEAFKEVSNLNAIVSTVNLHRAYESFDENVERLQHELISGLSVNEYLERYNELRELRLVDTVRLEKEIKA